jgi:hypothetical protein
LAFAVFSLSASMLVSADPVEDVDIVAGFTGTDLADTVDDTALGPDLVPADANAVGVFTPLTGPGDFDASVTAQADATGIDALAGDDDVDRSLATNIAAIADATGAIVAGFLDGDASLTADVSAKAKSVGIKAGPGDDDVLTIDSQPSGALTLLSNADATGIGVTLSVDGSLLGNMDASRALSKAKTSSVAETTGIDGGTGVDEIRNQAAITANAQSALTAVAVDLSVGVTRVGDIIVATDPGASVSGSSFSDSSSLAEARSTGIAGGSENDDIDNSGVLLLASGASAAAVDVSLDVAGSLDGNVLSGGALTDSSTAAEARTVGLAGGAGDDQVVNTGAVLGGAVADATAVGVSLGVSLTETGQASGSALSDAGVSAVADVRGIDGGDGDDVLTNTGPLTIGNPQTLTPGADADATAVAVALNLAGTMDGGAGGTALSDTTAMADATAIGMAGGAGNDFIDNRGAAAEIRTFSTADATAVGVSLAVSGQVSNPDAGGTGTGDVEGAVVSDSRAVAGALATGIAGDSGVDTIVNDAGLFSAAAAVGTAVSVGAGIDFNVGINVAPEGSVSAAALSDAAVDSTATAFGIDAGDDGDSVVNRGGLAVASVADATGVAVGLTIGGEVAYAEENGGNGGGTTTGGVTGVVLSNSRADATALASGVSGGGGADSIENVGPIAASATTDATAVAASVNLGFNVGINVAPEGDVSGAALSDAGVGATSIVSGLDGGGDNDSIENSGAISLAADAEAIGVAASLNLTGNVAYKGESEDDGNGGPADAVEGQALSNTATEAQARATAIEGGEGNDLAVNTGQLLLVDSNASAVGVAASLNVDAGVGIQSDVVLDVSGAAVSNASVQAESVAAGIDGGSGNDTVTNSQEIVSIQSDAQATGVAASLNVSGNLAYKGDTSGNIEGAALSDSSTQAQASAVALDGGDGDDILISEGSLGTIHAGADAVGVSASLNVAAGLAIQGDVNDATITGRAVSDASVTSAAYAAALDSGAGADQIHSTGDLARVEAIADATGVAASLDVAGSFSFKGDTDAAVSGQAVSNTGVQASSLAMGINSGAGSDLVTNEAQLGVVSAQSDALAVSAGLSVAMSVTVQGDSTTTIDGAALAKSDVKADATAIGIGGGAGDDVIVNSGDLPLVQSDATATGISAGLNVSTSVTLKGNSVADVTGSALSDTSVGAQAVTAGLVGGDGNDVVENSGTVNLLADSDATGIAASLGVEAAVTFKGAQQADVGGTAASDARVTASSSATGIDGGSGEDTLTNSGNITLMAPGAADAQALGVSASLNVAGNLAIKGISTGETSSVAGSNANVTAEASATGVSGGTEADRITTTNTSSITAYPQAQATGVAASLSVAGSMTGEATSAAMSEAIVTARSQATGIDGGDGDDEIINAGGIALMNQGPGLDQVDAEALAVSVSVEVAGTIAGSAEGEAISNAQTIAEAVSIGISGGEGSDSIENSGAIVADVDAETDTVAVGVSLNVTGAGTAEGAALTDARALSTALATGISGGQGDDTIENIGDISLNTDADAVATAVSVGLTGSARGQAEGRALADGSATAAAQSVGLDGGDGGDDITTADSTINTYAQSSSDSQSVSVNIAGAMGLASGASVADASANSETYSAAVAGGSGGDTITNGSIITAIANSSAEATSTSVGVTFGVGVAENASTGNSSATSRATAVGLDGGDDADYIVNSNAVFAGGLGLAPMASATSGSTTVNVTLGAGYLEGDTSAVAASLAEATALGLNGGAGDDVIENAGVITVGSLSPLTGLARADASATAVDVGITIGANANRTVSDTSATAVANLAGISGGEGNDTVDNVAELNVGRENGLAVAAADSRSVRVGVTLGASLGETSSNSSANAVANLAGISGGTGNDELFNTATINAGIAPPSDLSAFMTVATAGSDTVDVGVSVGGSFQDASADASANATSTVIGIAAGDDVDLIENSGEINAHSSALTIASGTATKASLNIGVSGGGATSNASATSVARAAGIDGGDGDDELITEGNVNVSSTSVSQSSSNSSDLNIVSIGVAMQSAEANSSASAIAEARGVNGAAGADRIRVGD